MVFGVIEDHRKMRDQGYDFNIDTQVWEKMMEEMAGMPKEEVGKREPGEIGTYERIRDVS